MQVARALHELLAYSNLCEAHHRIRRWKLYMRGAGQLALKQQPEDAFPLLIAAGHTPAQIREAMQRQIVDFVLTAHPTEATRRTLLAKYHRIATLLGVRDRTDLTPSARAHLDKEFEAEILGRQTC
jgi:phosphoenolpyruvate carboxylase